jgi:hypothetical protein
VFLAYNVSFAAQAVSGERKGLDIKLDLISQLARTPPCFFAS